MKTVYLHGCRDKTRQQMATEFGIGKHIIIGVKGNKSFSLESFIAKHPYFRVTKCPEVGNTNYREERNQGHVLQPAVIEYEQVFATQGQAAVVALQQANTGNIYAAANQRLRAAGLERVANL